MPVEETLVMAENPCTQKRRMRKKIDLFRPTSAFSGSMTLIHAMKTHCWSVITLPLRSLMLESIGCRIQQSTVNIQGGPKNKPLSIIIIKSY